MILQFLISFGILITMSCQRLDFSMVIFDFWTYLVVLEVLAIVERGLKGIKDQPSIECYKKFKKFQRILCGCVSTAATNASQFNLNKRTKKYKTNMKDSNLDKNGLVQITQKNLVLVWVQFGLAH